MKPFLIIILKYTIILFILISANFWLFSYSQITIPEYIAHTPVKVYGFVILCIYLPLMIIALKAVLKADPQITLLKLFFIGFLITSIPEMILHIVIASTYEDDRFFIFIRGFWVTTFIFSIICFFISYQLKIRNTGKLILFIVLLILIFNVIKYFYPALF